MGTCFLLGEVIEEGEASWDELVRRTERFRTIAVLRPDGYLAWVLDGRTQQRVGLIELRAGTLEANGFELGRFYSARQGVFRLADAEMRPVPGSPLLAEVYDDADLLGRTLDGAQEAFFALAMAIGKFLSRPVDGVIGLKDLPAGVAAMMASSPEYLEQFHLMTSGEQIQAISKLATTVIMMCAGGGAISAAARSGANGESIAIPVLDFGGPRTPQAMVARPRKCSRKRAVGCVGSEMLTNLATSSSASTKALSANSSPGPN